MEMSIEKIAELLSDKEKMTIRLVLRKDNLPPRLVLILGAILNNTIQPLTSK